MLSNYVFNIPNKLKTTQEFIKAYLKDVYSTFRCTTYIISDGGGELTSIQFTWLPQELECIKVCTSPYTPISNSVIEETHTFLNASLRKLICSHNTDWDNIAQIAVMTYNEFPHSLSGEAPLHLMFGHDALMPTLFEFLLPKLRYMGDEKCKIHPDTRSARYC